MTIFELLYSGEVDDLIRNLSLSLHSAPFSLSLSKSKPESVSSKKSSQQGWHVQQGRRKWIEKVDKRKVKGVASQRKKERKIEDVRI